MTEVQSSGSSEPSRLTETNRLLSRSLGTKSSVPFAESWNPRLPQRTLPTTPDGITVTAFPRTAAGSGSNR